MTMNRDACSTVLVVDDEPTLVGLAARMLEPDGYHVLTATSGAEALAICATRTGSIDLLLTDLHMPEMTGRGLATEMRKTELGLKVLYLTAHSDDLFGTLTLLEPHEAFIEKPITPKGIRDAVSLHLYGTLTPPARSADPLDRSPSVADSNGTTITPR
jgi:two-component system cell cycle sensor histidine kinase/response regulator CckA